MPTRVQRVAVAREALTLAAHRADARACDVLKLLPVLDRSAIAVEAEVAQAQGSLVEEEAFDRAAADDFALEQWCAMRPEQLTVALHATLHELAHIPRRPGLHDPILVPVGLTATTHEEAVEVQTLLRGDALQAHGARLATRQHLPLLHCVLDAPHGQALVDRHSVRRGAEAARGDDVADDDAPVDGRGVPQLARLAWEVSASQ
eukprot:CAMPEP_0176188126 /NCGR_PEP_ID=MMETSP0121_2-20121125/2754_1 /TAXON_ID=160619 /ORGANISM="Kryptoperidinium foliaceum, Strain CCMP 1326" /LENGTH=203 /DNA_ID=CAMNT_0017526691 /DNA_START=160 /DNA_END=771 /DNA_ORIENTATION=-